MCFTASILFSEPYRFNKYKKNALLCKRLPQSVAEDHGTERSTENLVPDRGWCRCGCCIPAVGWRPAQARECASASGRSLRSGRPGPGSAGPRSRPRGSAPETGWGARRRACGFRWGSGKRWGIKCAAYSGEVGERERENDSFSTKAVMPCMINHSENWFSSCHYGSWLKCSL